MFLRGLEHEKQSKSDVFFYGKHTHIHTHTQKKR